MSETLTLIYDVELRRPACVILQAAAGCDFMEMHSVFSSVSWLTAPTPGMRRITGTRDEWQRAAKLQPAEQAK